MKTSNWMKRFAAIAGSALVGLIFATVANAAPPEPVPVEVRWVDPIGVAVDQNMQFGMLDVNMIAAQTVIINTDDSFTESTPDTVVAGPQRAADVTITVAASTLITILADNHQGANDYSLDTWICNYDAQGDTACDVPYNLTSKAAASGVLIIGATLHANGSATVGTDDSTFDVTVIYQ